jgi:DNA-binding transcriptional MerR regulator
MFGNGHIESGDGKSFYRIGEVSRLTDTKPFVLRYWETEFPTLQPVKSPKGHRLYRREDVETVLRIKRLLYDEGFTIAGARRHLREEGEPPNGAKEDQLTEGHAVAKAYAAAANGPSVETESRTDGFATEEPGTEQLGMESWLATEDRPSAQDRMAAERRPEAPATIGRKVLLDLRDSLQAFLTLLENE